MRKILGIFLISLIMTGCGTNTNLMRPVEEGNVKKIDENTSRVVFGRTSFIGNLINASVYDVTNDETKFIGFVNYGTKLAYDTKPGQRIFMVVSEAADFMQANLAPGKEYDVVVAPRPGVWKARFSLRPIEKTNAPDFNNLKWVENSPEALEWFSNNKGDILNMRSEYYKQWLNKTDDQKLDGSVKAENGK